MDTDKKNLNKHNHSLSHLRFVHLHVHSSYSRMQGVSSPAQIFAASRNNWMDTIALTDTNGLYGLILALEQAREYGVRLIIGSELVTPDNRALCLAKDGRGYKNLCRLISDLHCKGGFDLCEALSKQSTGLVIITDDEKVLKQVRKEKKQDLYVELSPGYLMHQAYAFSIKTGIPPVATNRVYFTGPEYYPIHKLARAIDLNTKLSRLTSNDICLESNYLKSPKDMIDHFPHAPHAIENTIRIAEACKKDWEFGKIVFPSF